VKYLGVVLDNRRNFGWHIETLCARADAVVGAIRGLLPNVNGSSNACRGLYYQVWESVVLYASPVWKDALNTIKAAKELRKAQRSALIGTSTAYRTVSHATLCVLTGTIPIHIRARWRWKIFEKKKLVRFDPEEPEVRSARLARLEEKALEEWKGDWSQYNPANWTRRLIADGTTFWRKKRGIDHYTMQLLTGHGIFNQYRLRINKAGDDKCWDCEASLDDAEHAPLHCPRWVAQRTTLENMVGQRLSVQNIIGIVTADDRIWEQF
jgi:hypothetical protein